MKIQKFNENYTDKEYYIIIEQDNYDTYYLFDDEKKACDFVVGKLYESFKDNEDVLKSLDNIENSEDVNYDIDDIINYYEYHQERYYNMNKMSYYIVNDIINYKFPKWVEIRRNSNKYNL